MTRVDVQPPWQDYYADEEPQRPSWWLALAGGLAAASAVGLGLLLIRSALQVRSVPERVLEWLLLFVPLDVFESGLQRFGFSAKRYALYFAIALMLALLTWLGAVALRRRWSLPVLLGLGIGVWLFTMLVIMPLTSAGVFALDLLEGKRSTILGYLGVGLLFSSVLVHCARADRQAPRRRAGDEYRRGHDAAPHGPGPDGWHCRRLRHHLPVRSAVAESHGATDDRGGRSAGTRAVRRARAHDGASQRGRNASGRGAADRRAVDRRGADGSGEPNRSANLHAAAASRGAVAES